MTNAFESVVVLKASTSSTADGSLINVRGRVLPFLLVSTVGGTLSTLVAVA